MGVALHWPLPSAVALTRSPVGKITSTSAPGSAVPEMVGRAVVTVWLLVGASMVSVADEFLKVVANTSHHPLFINCGSANRVGAMWVIKRMVIDKWEQDKAVEEAKAIGLSSAALEKWALDYVAKRR